MKKLFSLLVITLLFGCASTMTSKLGTIDNIATNRVELVDKRALKDKEYYRSGMTSPIQQLGDHNFEPNLLKYFQYKLAQQAEVKGKFYRVEIDTLKVIDNFSYRMGAGQAGALAGIGVHIKLDSVKGADFIVLDFSGTVNNTPIKFQEAHKYKVSGASMNTFDDPEFKKAFNKTIDSLVDKIISV